MQCALHVRTHTNYRKRKYLSKSNTNNFVQYNNKNNNANKTYNRKDERKKKVLKKIEECNRNTTTSSGI